MKVLISQVRPNPFQVRKQVDRERVQALADEIKALGYWGSLRARKKGSHYELCFGHRRLEALKLLKVKEVDLEVVDLTDSQMATQGLVENMQREGLTDIEKAEGIKQLIKHLESDGEKHARRQVAEMMGLGEGRISSLLSLFELSQPSQRLIQRGEIGGVTAIFAKRLGGDAMIETAATHKLPLHTINKISMGLAAIPDPDIREKVTKAVIAGKVRDPEAVRTQERQLRARRDGPAPTDLRLIIRKWTRTMEEWSKRLDDVLPFMDYVEEEPTTAKEFKTITRELIEKLKRFL